MNLPGYYSSGCMLHDIGKFEQIKRYNTFSDADSIDHAVLRKLKETAVDNLVAHI